MEDLNSTTVGTNSPASRSREASTDTSQNIQDLDEHADSPLRKRPRLEPASVEATDMSPSNEEGATDNLPSSDAQLPQSLDTSPSAERTESLPSSHPVPHTPSKVTLNLRNTNNLPPDSSAEDDGTEPMSGLSPHNPNIDQQQSVEHEQNIPTSPSSKDGPSPPSSISSPSPVVEIEVDDPEDIHNGDFDNVINMVGAPSVEAQIIERFPYADQWSPVEAAKRVAHHLGNNDLEPSLLLDISHWLENWLQHLKGHKSIWNNTYDDLEFWTALGQVYQKFLTRRVDLGKFTPTSETGTRQEVVQKFLEPYVRICGHFIHLDLCRLAEQPSESSRSNTTWSSLHIRNLDKIFQPRNDNNVWFPLERSYAISSAEIHQSLALQFLWDPDESLFSLLELMRNYVRNAFKWNVHQFVSLCLRIFLWISHGLKMSGFVLENEQQRRTRDAYCGNLLEYVRETESMLQQNMGQQNTALPIDYTLETVNNLGCLVQYIADLNEPLASRQFALAFPERSDVEPDDYPILIRHALVHKVLWNFITKGRMELRAQSVLNFAKGLVNLWQNYRGVNNCSHPVLQAATDLLEQDNVVAYLVSVESHVQLIQRSNDVIGFVLVTHRWNQQMTDAIWTSISTIQDQRFATGICDSFGNIFHLAQTPDLVKFCETIGQTQLSGFTQGMMTLTIKLLETFAMGSRTVDGSQLEPYQLCIRFIRETFAIDASETEPVVSFRYTLSDLLQTISKKHSNATQRRILYNECLQDVKNRTRTSTGSLEAVRALITKHTPQDMSLLVQHLDIWDILAEDICDFVQSCVNGQLQFRSSYLLTRLKLFQFLMIFGPTPPISEPLQKKIWDHLVGEMACDPSSRDQAWDVFVDVVTQCPEKHEFVDRCITQFLPALPAALDTNGLLRFVQASMHYMQRVDPPTNPGDGLPLEVPLSDYLWNIILTAPEQSIEKSAVLLMSRQYLDPLIFDQATKASAEATHRSLIEKCVSQLKGAAKKLNSYMDGTLSGEDEPMIIVPTDVERQREELRFARTLQFLRQFLVELKARPNFRIQQADNAPLPDSPVTADKGEAVVMKYQAYGPGLDTSTREFSIGSLSTLSDLYKKLCKFTGFADCRVYQGGAPLDLKQDPSRTVDSIASKGCLLVKSPPDRTSSVNLPSPQVGNTIAEKTILEHFDDLYDFLDLEENLAAPVLDFLAGFPPHDRIREIVVSEDPRIADLFPSGKRVKTLYSLRSLKEHLALQQNPFPDEKLIVHGVKILTKTLIDPEYNVTLENHPENHSVLASLINCLNDYLMEKPLTKDSAAYFADPVELAKRLHDILMKITSMPGSELAYQSARIYTTVIEASFHSPIVWKTFISLPETNMLHYWLLTANTCEELREAIKECIVRVCSTDPDSSLVSKGEFASYYWKTIADLIPGLVKEPHISKELFATASAVFLDFDELHQDEESLQSLFNLWSRLLAEHEYSELPSHRDVDQFVLGLSQLLSHCLSSLKSSKKPIRGQQLADVVFNKYLFPGTYADLFEDATAGPEKPSMPIVDVETRSVLYGLLLSLCQDVLSYRKLVACLKRLETLETENPSFPWGTDHERWLRTSPGYSGLRNLANTCYMNSLLTQLFMNFDFRKFMLNANVADAHGSQRLLAETQSLFSQMQNSNEKFADTEEFTRAIKPYEGHSIDTAIQMDVEEFYNLLFDRWESQMLTAEAKQNFRSFYGGQLVTQIKSKDCSHVSETFEPFLVIQCDVKGKASLGESLKTYVEGDVMEGDNKYKCESCGGKLVNAVKRSCLKDLPDNLIFTLKRFEFDLNTLLRYKINDRFEFPNSIDMKYYTPEHLNNPEKDLEKDVFELVGILVHNGTAETGHYYSYIRLPTTSRKSQTGWVEFNDAEVSEFEPNKIPDQCFGGMFDTSGVEYQWMKPYNAYMLFYRRVAALTADAQANAGHSGVGPVMSSIPAEYAKTINEQNGILIRRYCLYNRTHALFVKNVMGALKNITKGICSEDHKIEKDVIYMALGYIESVACRMKDAPDFELIAADLKKVICNCDICCHVFLGWLPHHELAVRDMLLTCPHQKVRAASADLIYAVLKDQRDRKSHYYGFDTFDDDLDQLLELEYSKDFPQTVTLLHDLFRQLGELPRLWNEFFGLWYSMASLGVPELALILKDGIFSDCLELLLVDREGTYLHRSRHLEDTLYRVQRAKRPPSHDGLVKLIWCFLRYVDPFADAVQDRVEGQIETKSTDPLTFHPTRHERIMIQHFEPGKKRYPFLVKILDGSEYYFQQKWYPGEIIDTLLKFEVTESFVSRMASTFIGVVDEFLPSVILQHLKGAIYFCKSTPFDKSARQIIKAVASNASDVDNMEETRRDFQGVETQFPASGGHNYLDFLRDVALLNRVKSAESDEECPFLGSVIMFCPQWAPALLRYQDKATRDDTVSLLDVIIFSQFPNEQNEQVEQIDLVRNKAIPELFNRLNETVQKKIELSMTRAYISQTLSVMQACAMWAERVAAADSKTFERMKEDCDETVFEKFRSVQSRLPGGADEEGDDALTETEWASNFDDDSDDLTDTAEQ